MTSWFAKLGASLAGLLNKAMGIATHFAAYMAGKTYEKHKSSEAVREVEDDMRDETTKHRTTKKTKNRLKKGKF